jgi:hypothetical protein
VTITSGPALGSIFPGAKLTGTGIVSSPATTVSSISGSTITMSQNATASGSVTLTVTGNPASIGFRWLQQGVDTSGNGTTFVREDILGATTVGGQPGAIIFYNPVAGDGANGTIPPALLTLAGDGSGGVTVGTAGVNAPLTVNGNLTATGTSTSPSVTVNNGTTAYNLSPSTFYTGGAVPGILLQNSTTNARSMLGIVPNGTSNLADIWLFSTSDHTTNFSTMAWGYDAGDNAWGWNALSGGSGAVHPFFFNATGAASEATSNLLLNTDGSSAFHGAVTLPLLVGSGSAPSISAGAGAGTSPTVSLAGTNLAGEITITTGTAPTASATVATITLAGGAAFPNHAEPILQPMNAAAHALTGAAGVYCPQGGTTSWTVSSDSSALPASTTLVYRYQVAGY